MRRNEEIASHIAALLLDDDGLEGIEARLGGFNLFEAIGHTRTEARHSDFLAFLLGVIGRIVRRITVTGRPERRARRCRACKPLSCGQKCCSTP